MINIETIKNYLGATEIYNLIFDPAIIFINNNI